MEIFIEIEWILNSLKELEDLIGEPFFESYLLKKIYSIFNCEEIYLLTLKDNKLIGIKYFKDSFEELFYKIDEFEKIFNINFNKIKTSPEGVLEEESIGISQKIFIFKPKNLDEIYILILKKITNGMPAFYLKIFFEILKILIVCHYEIKKLRYEMSNIITENLHFIFHELKNPLTTIEISLDLLYSSEIDFQERKKIYQIAKTTLIDIKEMIDDLLHYKPQILDNNIENFSFAFIVDEIIKELEPLAIFKNVKIITNIKDFIIKGNKEKFKKALYNILINAIKYNKINGKVIIESKEYRNKFIIKIKDTGVGISKEDQKKIFEKGFRSSKVHGIPGTGLGLYITKKIIESHNGNIKVKSKLGEGSEFIISLPKKVIS